MTHLKLIFFKVKKLVASFAIKISIWRNNTNYSGLFQQAKKMEIIQVKQKVCNNCVPQLVKLIFSKEPKLREKLCCKCGRDYEDDNNWSNTEPNSKIALKYF